MAVFRSSLKPTVVILSVSSDIGLYLAKRYLQDGFGIIGTYRTYGNLSEIEGWPDCHLLQCNISRKENVNKFLKDFKKLKIYWNLFISCVGDLRPYGNFFQTDFDGWNDAVHINSIEQLRIIHGLYPFRNKNINSSVIFFAGGGVNNPVPYLSAYTASKIMLIKMCELLDAENSDLKVFIVGPGFIKTKIHKLIKANIARGKKEIEMADVYEGMRWLVSQNKNVVGGRNFSVAYDLLNNKAAREILKKKLIENGDMYKLRRRKNDG